MRRVVRGLCGILGLSSAWAATACGDSNAGTDGVERPAWGFYEVRTATNHDSCSPVVEQGTAERIVETDKTGILLTTWSTLGDTVPWAGLPETEGRCGYRVSYELSDVTAASFKLVSNWTWTDPGSCTYPANVVVPKNSCIVQKVETFELIDPCPTQRNNVGCPAAPNE